MARRLTLEGASVLVLEKALDVLDGASKGNSAILHTGFDAPPGSVEQRCIAAGYAEYLDVADSMSLPVLRSTAMVLAWNKDQLETLPSLVEKAHKNGVTDVAMLSVKDIKAREPHLSDGVVGGFEVPGEFLIDPWASAHAYILQALANGAELARGTEVLAGAFDDGLWTLKTSQGNFEARTVINCAGLYGDIVDERLIGIKSFTITPRKGQFVVFDKAASDLVSAIILPVPTKTTKGIVICRTIFGNVLVGPTAEDQTSRTDASTHRDALKSLRAKGIEMLPDLEYCEITTAYAGLRPASEFQDYQISHRAECNYVTVGGIRSTGLSAALGIALYVHDQIGSDEFQNGPLADPVIPSPDRLSNYHIRDWESAGNEGIICHCELVTRREIERALDGPMPPATLQGLKRRTRVTMGRCQGFYCNAELAEMTKDRLKRPIGSDDG
jgi:glycerol-3-phosphate dehydrogenase